MTEEQADQVFDLACEKYISEAGAYRKTMNRVNNTAKNYLKKIESEKEFDEEEADKFANQYKKYDKRMVMNGIDNTGADAYHADNNAISAATPEIVKRYKKRLMYSILHQLILYRKLKR